MSKSEELATAEAFLAKLDSRGPEIGRYLRSICPDLADDLIRRLYGEVYQRPGLSLKERMLISVAAVSAAGDMAPEIAYQSNLALRNGVTFDELMEVLVQVSVFCGFARAVNAMNVIAAEREKLRSENAIT